MRQIKHPLVLTKDKPFWQSVWFAHIWICMTHLTTSFHGAWFSAASLKTQGINRSLVIRCDSTRPTRTMWINLTLLSWKFTVHVPEIKANWIQHPTVAEIVAMGRHDSLSFCCLQRAPFSAKHTRHSPIRSHWRLVLVTQMDYRK